MKKIAHFIDSNDPGGAETIVIDICKGIRPYGFNSEVYHFGNSWLKEKCKEFDIPSFIAPGHRFYKSIKTIPIFSIAFARFLQRNKVDILHSHRFGSITGACLSAYLSNTPHIGTLHDVYTIEERKKRIHLLKMATVLGTRLITVSQQMKGYLDGLGKFRNGAMQTIVNGVDIEKFNIPVDKKLRSELHLNHEDIVFICVGRLEKIKGHDILIQAFSKVKTAYNVKLLIVGDGQCKKEIENDIAKTGLQNNVIMLGHRNDIPEFLKLSNCFVLASRSEGLSCSIIEAMAAGLPVIATDVGGNSELVKDGENGYLVSRDNPTALADKIQVLINNEAKRKQFGKASLRLADKSFSLNAMIEKYVNNYNEMINTN